MKLEIDARIFSLVICDIVWYIDVTYGTSVNYLGKRRTFKTLVLKVNSLLRGMCLECKIHTCAHTQLKVSALTVLKE